MFQAIQEFFEKRIRTTSGEPDSIERALQLATAALLVEVSRADHEIKDEERRVIASIHDQPVQDGVDAPFGDFRHFSP